LLDGAWGHAPVPGDAARVLLRINAPLTMYPEIEEVDMNRSWRTDARVSMAVDSVRIHR
jgi:hypothetical protein